MGEIKKHRDLQIWQKSMGSLFELQTELEISHNLNFLNLEIFESSFKLTRQIERMMSSFI